MSASLFSMTEAKPLRVEDLAGITSDVLVANGDKATLIAQGKGGWEGWLQGELSAALLTLGYDVEREVHCYGDRRAADLVMPKTVVELKALGLARDPSSFYDGVDIDVAKLQELDGVYERRFGVVVVPGFTEDAFPTAQKRLSGFAFYNRAGCAELGFNLFTISNP